MEVAVDLPLFRSKKYLLFFVTDELRLSTFKGIGMLELV
jgi:hypothetical protein